METIIHCHSRLNVSRATHSFSGSPPHARPSRQRFHGSSITLNTLYLYFRSPPTDRYYW